MENSKIKEAVIKQLKALKSEGKNLLAGSFIARNGDVTLDVTTHSDREYHICYCACGVMYNWIVDKSVFN